jgi:hypothetical protein
MSKSLPQVNSQRVSYRKLLIEEKHLLYEEKCRRATEAEEKRLSALLRIASQVPYADRIANVQADPLKPTAFIKVRGRVRIHRLLSLRTNPLVPSSDDRATRSCPTTGLLPSNRRSDTLTSSSSGMYGSGSV